MCYSRYCTTRKALADNPYCGKRLSVFGPRIQSSREAKQEHGIRDTLRHSSTVYTILLEICLIYRHVAASDTGYYLSVVSRLVKHMIPMPSNTLASEHRGKALTFGHLLLVDALVTAFCLTNDEFTHLESYCQ